MNGTTVGAAGYLSTYVPDLMWKVRGVGDVNGDGYADLLWQNISTGGLGVWYMQNFVITHQYGLSILGCCGSQLERDRTRLDVGARGRVSGPGTPPDLRALRSGRRPRRP